jgi:hypothetical protein
LRLCRLAYLSAPLRRTLQTLPLLPRGLLALWVPQVLLGPLGLPDLPDPQALRASPAAAVIPALQVLQDPRVPREGLALRAM